MEQSSRARCAAILILLAGAASLASARSEKVRVSIYPAQSVLRGKSAQQAFLVTAAHSDQMESDVTRDTQFRIEPAGIVTVSATGVATPLGEGKARIEATYRGKKTSAYVTVTDLGIDRPVSFLRDIAPILTEKGCTGSNCHGSVRGKAGFKLSLFGANPDQDYEAIVKAADGRRVNLQEPANSLFVRKPAFQVPHGGGIRFEPGSAEYKTLLSWIAGGCVYDSGGPTLKGISVFPSERILVGAGAKQRFIVTGRYSDGSQADLTEHVRYTVNDETVAAIDDAGEVTGKRQGETSLMIRTQGKTAVARVAIISAPPGPDYPSVAENNFIDTLVFAKLRRMNIVPSELAPDSVFLRRVYLDTVGTMPTPDEARRFLESKSPDKRARLIDDLMARPEFVDVWALKFADLFQLGGAGVKGGWLLYRWIRQSLEDEKPYDQMVREMLLGTGPFVYEPTVNFYKGMWNGPEGMVTQVSQSLLGIRMDCAKCHDHPFERWTQNDFYGMAGFFTRLQYKAESYGLFERSMVTRPDNQPTYDYVNNNKMMVNPRTKQVVQARYLGGDVVEVKPGEDIREKLADWITSPDNPWFSKAIANRVWKHYLGRGVVEPVDDFRVTNPPSNQALLNALASELVKDKFDLKKLMRVILNSRTYQLSSAPNPSNEADTTNYSRYYVKRQIAEVLYDSIGQASGKRLRIPGSPPEERAIHIAVGSPDYFLTAFGKVQFRDQICERDQEPDVAQAMNLINGDTVNHAVTASGNIVDQILARQDWSDARRIEEIYLTALSRYPTPEESAELSKQISGAEGESRKKIYQDVLWAVLNSQEFAYVH